MDTLNGLPAHILLVHAVVVLLPLAALLLVLTAVWPAARRHLALANAVLSVVVVALVPLTTSAGEWLEHQVDESALVRDHAELGDTALFVAVPVAVLALIIWWRGREIDTLLAEAATSPPAVRTMTEGSAGPAPAVGTVERPTRRRMFLAPESALVTVVLAVLSVLAAGAAVYDTYLIGDSGAQATWQGEVPVTPGAGSPAEDNG